ncbi:Endothelin-converting enzyme [Lachnellula suecica]|uniref:Endothelin-converting enzyme n=1 Tax=Lachnellula suecica TaxID=602035 RepID=A0A8T9CL78_9HELO|nr:Endothelin-converting enzyme [Lachnellula suecica]
MSSEAELKELSEPSFWDTRYATAERTNDATIDSFEWFRSFPKIRPFLEKWLPSPGGSEVVLHLGCGNSVCVMFTNFQLEIVTDGGPKTLTADLHEMGYTHQLSVDFSLVVIDAMRLKYASLNTTWQVMDVRGLKLDAASVNVAIDQGTLDAFLHGSLWDPPDDVRENVGKYVDEVARVLKPGGKWLYITYRQPHFMKPLLTRENEWKLEVEALEDLDGGGEFDYFVFVMERNQN